MLAKFIAALLTLIAHVSAGVVIFAVMLMAMNGYSESDAMWGLGAYIALAFLITLGMSILAAFSVKRLQDRKFNTVVAVLVTVAAFSFVGTLLNVICGFVGVIAAEIIRVNF
ncbi:hypothetical protein BH20ACI2_BH20ACI2_08230 [soil metagenome]